MAWKRADLPYWLEDAADTSQSPIDTAQTDQLSSGTPFGQFLDQLNASPWLTDARSSPRLWQHDTPSTDTTVDAVSSSSTTLSGHAANWLGTHWHYWHHQTPDHPGTVTVTSSESGFVEGAVVTAHLTDPDGVKAASISYQWSSVGADQIWHPIGANSPSYTLTADDVGKQIDVVATYTDMKGHNGTAADPFMVTDPAVPDPPPANSPGVLSVSSTDGFNEGSTVTASVADADGVDPNAVVYTWQQLKNGNWTDVGTGQTHPIGFADGGSDFRVTATYTDNAGNPEAPLPVVFTALDLNQPGELTVTSSGNGFIEGDVVTAHVTDADGLDQGSITYQWSSAGADQIWHPIGTNSASYTLAADDVGKQIDVVATYVDQQGHAEAPADPFTVAAAPNNPDPPPPPPPVNTPGVLTVSSTNGFNEGAKLTANVTDADGLGVGSVVYAWQEQINNAWTNIGTGQTHTIGSNDGGNNFRVLASYTDGAGNAEAPAPVSFIAGDVNQPGTVTVTSSGNGFIEGATLTANVTDLDGVGAGAVVYTWQEQINNTWTNVGTGQTHALGSNDGGNNFRVLANYTDAGGHAEAPVSSVIPAVDVNQPGSVTVTSSGSGFVEGATLTAKVSDLDGLGAAAALYTWQEQINNVWTNVGTGQTHALGFNDGGNNFRVLANYTDAGGHTEAPVSAVIPAVDVDRAGTLTVTSSGSGFALGDTITTHLTDPDGVGAATYQWSSAVTGGPWVPISGATAATYTLTANDAGKQIDVVATYTDGQGHHDTAADPFTVAPTSPGGGGGSGGSGGGSNNGATLLWSQEFDTPLDMKSSSNPDGLWAPVDFWQNINSAGYKDFAGTNWNINPNNPTFAAYNPFSVHDGYLEITESRVPANLVAPIQASMASQQQSGAVPTWMGGELITNKDVVDFTYGYFEFRERIPDGGKGMFPAMWFYSADESGDAQGKSTAEIDLYEVFGTPNQWHTNLHPGTEVGVTNADTAGWHTYGMLWEKDTLQFYEDGKLLYSATPQQASYYNDLHLAIRVNFAMDAPWFPASAHSDSTTLSTMHMQIDYIRQYAALPFATTG